MHQTAHFFLSGAVNLEVHSDQVDAIIRFFQNHPELLLYNSIPVKKAKSLLNVLKIFLDVEDGPTLSIEEWLEFWIQLQKDVVNKYFNNFMSTHNFEEWEVIVLQTAFRVNMELGKLLDAPNLRQSQLSKLLGQLSRLEDLHPLIPEDDYNYNLEENQAVIYSEYTGEPSYMCREGDRILE